ncbi:MAG: S41 family peptidase [Candidatus Sulfotelmatobacter sp.]
MLRFLYRCVLRLHPPGFRARFADEMLSTFDQTASRPGAKGLPAVGLLADGLVSMVRQWTLRPDFRHEPAPAQQSAADGAPCFYILDPFRPRAGAVIHGVVLSTAVFCLTCFAIRYSWIHILHVHIPVVQFESPQSMPRSTGAGALPQKPTVPPSSQDETSVPLSATAHSSLNARFNAPSNVTSSPAAVAIQNRTAHTSASRSSEIRTSKALASEPQERSATSSGLSETPALQARTQPQVGTQVDPMQAAQPELQHEASATSRAIEDVKLDAAERHRVISGAIANLTKYYIDPDIAEKMANTLQAHEKNSDDDAATDGAAFADLLTAQMRDVGHDKYVMIVYSKATTPENPLAPSSEDVARYRREMGRNNCMFEKARLLPHNIGYLKFDGFPDASICGATAAAAMASLNHADAVLLDLRDNQGGYANMVAFIATYLFDHPTHLNDFYNRGENSTEQSWTLPRVPGNRLADKPVFVLTSHSTFSAAEAFSYDLKILKRATIVGETTSGQGHIGMEHRIDDHFTIRIPGIRVVNPISKANWEGTGVEPDVKVKAAHALGAAEKLAESRLQKR